jgi:DNA-binding FrmR family transcriptional regulator
MKHQSHPAILKRLKRTEGHLRGVIAMLEAHRSCLDLAQQLHAVEKAVSSAKRELIHDHLEHCLEGDGTNTRLALREMKQLAKYL